MPGATCSRRRCRAACASGTKGGFFRRPMCTSSLRPAPLLRMAPARMINAPSVGPGYERRARSDETAGAPGPQRGWPQRVWACVVDARSDRALDTAGPVL